jgi:polyphosphate kinase 2 (PPK2 family)
MNRPRPAVASRARSADRIALTDATATDDAAPRGDEARTQLEPLLTRLVELQAALYAESRQALLVVLQGRDSA